MLSWLTKKSNLIKRQITSPSGAIVCTLTLDAGQLTYEIAKNDTTLIRSSRLGFKIAGAPNLQKNLTLTHFTTEEHAETIELPWGEDQFIPNNYHAATLELSEAKSPFRTFQMEFRVFDDGVAFRYALLPQKPSDSQGHKSTTRITILDELTEFNLDPAATAWKIDAYQPDRYEYNYEKTKVGDLRQAVHTPLTVKTPDGTYLGLHEAALYDYGAMNLKFSQQQRLQADITPLSDRTKAHIDLPFRTPWRVIMIADSAPELTRNRMIYALNDPPRQDFSWVQTLKFIGVWWAMYVGEWTWAPGPHHGATTEHAKEYIDAAIRLGVQGLLIEGWNEGGWEGDWLENGPHNQFAKSTADFDLPAVARYAASRGIELIGHHETVGFVDNYEKQLGQAYNFCAMNHIHYLKTGYAGAKMLIHGHEEWHHSQLGVQHYQKTIELAARKHICLGIHEPIKGTGIERTWPNLLTREGARGQEYEGGSLKPDHACILPYTRLLAGGMDYTPGIFDLQNPKKPVKTTLARQLAYFVTIYSGMTMAADRPFIYEEKFPQVFRFIRAVPTNFAKTLPLKGEIGEYYIVVRQDRDSEDWYLGGVTNETPRHFTIPLDFLAAGTYQAEVYADAIDAHYLNNPFAIDIYQKTVTARDSLDPYLAPGGGFAVRFHKIDLSLL